MVNTTYPEIQETKVAELPPASLDTLIKMREDACSTTSFGFKLQPQQRFLRRVLSPDSPTQNLLLVHGTGQGKSCSAIQISEEYILRPEFQDKKVLVLANPSIQENFRNQIFDVSRVNVDAEGLLTSKQCTGRRYLDILQRGQKQSLKISSRENQEQLRTHASKIISEFYEFQGYGEFANVLAKQPKDDVDSWIHTTFDNRLIIVDEAHNLRETSETNVDPKLISAAIKKVVQTANGITLVLLTATPMYDRYEEIFDYFNLFLWNSRKQVSDFTEAQREDIRKRLNNESVRDLAEELDVSEEMISLIKKNVPTGLHTSMFFKENGDFVSNEAEAKFRNLCETYISFVKGENPFTFPFRLPPPEDIIAKPDRTEDLNGEKITSQIKYLPLTQSIMSDFQSSVVEDLTIRGLSEYRTICVLPENKDLKDVFDKREGQYFYKNEKFLSPSNVATYSSKFALITKLLSDSDGVVFIYSNLAELGVQLFAMCLEEHGYDPASGNRILGEPTTEAVRGSKGKYALITSQSSDTEISKILTRLRRKENINGQDIRVVLASPKVSEGVDFRFVRQIHILDPWFNMSRIEQVIGRGMRVCSHSLLPFEKQNTTVYLHVCRYADKTKETHDEYIYRAIVEQKGIAIAKVKKVIMESAMDCELEHAVNSLPADWKNLKVPQIRNQDNETLELPIGAMSSPTFIQDTGLVCKVGESTKDDTHMRPLSAILDVRDEVLDKLLGMFSRKAIWTFKDIYNSKELKQYEPSLVSYIVQNLVETRTIMKDEYGRLGHLEIKSGLLTFAIHDNETLQDKIVRDVKGNIIELEFHKPEEIVKQTEFDLEERISEYKWPDFAKVFSSEVKLWYFVDHVLKPEEKQQYIFGLDWSNPPIYASVLRTENMYIFGNNNVYNTKFEKFVPIGAEKDEYDAWVKALKERFISTKNQYFAGLKRGEGETKLIFNLDEKSIPIKKAERSKGIGGRACLSYSVDILNAFVEWLGSKYPAEVKNRGQKCIFLDMLIRKAILEKKEGIVWYTPEEWDILSEDKKALK